VSVAESNINISSDVRILQFCACRVLRRIGERVQNWPSSAELTKLHRNGTSFAGFVQQYKFGKNLQK